MKHDLDYMLQVMQAMKDGKEIEFLDLCNNNSKWELCFHPVWDWSYCDYRIKPEQPNPEYVPYESAEEFLQAQKEHGMYIMTNDIYEPFCGDEEDLWYIMPIEVSSNCAIFVDVNTSDKRTHVQYGFSYLVKFIWQDGTPVGKLKQ